MAAQHVRLGRAQGGHFFPARHRVRTAHLSCVLLFVAGGLTRTPSLRNSAAIHAMTPLWRSDPRGSALDIRH